MFLSKNKSLEDIPSRVMRTLTSIKILDLRAFPDSFGALKQLAFLRLARAPIMKLPDSITFLKKLQMLDIVDQSLKTGKKQAWHAANITNACVGFLAGLKASLRSRSMESETEVFKRMQSVFQRILAEDIFAILDMETDSRIGKLVRATIDRLLDAACPSCPSRWLQICRNVVLATSAKKGTENGYPESETGHDNFSFGEDDEGMIVSSKKVEGAESVSSRLNKVDKSDQLPWYRTRIFAAECLSRIPVAVGIDSTYFDLAQARKEKKIHGLQASDGDWLVLHLAELVALAYKVSTCPFEKMRPLCVTLLSTIVDKFEKTEDPNLHAHLTKSVDELSND